MADEASFLVSIERRPDSYIVWDLDLAEPIHCDEVTINGGMFTVTDGASIEIHSYTVEHEDFKTIIELTIHE